MLETPVRGLAALVRRFRRERFMADYGQDAPLVRRIGRVVTYVGLPALPDDLWELLPTYRVWLRREMGSLVPPE